VARKFSEKFLEIPPYANWPNLIFFFPPDFFFFIHSFILFLGGKGPNTSGRL